MAKHSDYIIEQFELKDEDFKTYADLISEGFLAVETAETEGATVIFTEETVRTVFGGPGVDRKIMVRAKYKPTDEIVGFLGTINKSISIEGKVYKSAIPAWLVVKPKHQRKGLAKAMGMKMLEIGKTSDYDAAFSFHEPGQHGIDTSTAVARETDTPIVRIFTFKKFIIRAFDVDATSTCVKLRWFEKLFFKLKEKVGKVKSDRVRLYKPEDFEQIFKLTQDLVKKSQISIVPEYEDLKWMLSQPNVLCTVYEDEEGKPKGYILVWGFTLAGLGNTLPFGWLDTVHTYNLNNKEVKELINFMSQKSIEKGWKGIQSPYIPYYQSKPLIKANFIFFRMEVGVDLFNWKNIPVPEKVNSVYFIWR